ncbi:MAG TPA: polyprenyl synthetase family protein [Candidatus Latescibacteria bacterium]|nr:polyprenyl synthetase family protein [Candidatus Latescibacterota bacterium]
MTFEGYFQRTKRRLLADLDEFLSAKGKDMAGLKSRGTDVLRRLAEFTRKGKMIRGGLVLLGSEMAGGRISRAAVRAGTAFELIQSGLLIHDDIMDRDARRRGAPSIHEQYARLAERPGTLEAAHFGTSMAICAGEISIFLAFEALAGLPGPGKSTAAVQKLFASEFGLVGLGQMRDIRAGTSTRRLGEREVLDIYRHKTARYSFSLPLASGWMLAGGRGSVLPKLLSLGEDLGLVFQIKDDELGLFGSERTLGKPIGSDIRQGKKTLFHSRLLDRASAGPDRNRLSAVFGHRNASKQDIDFVRDMAMRLGVREDVGRVMERFGKRAAKAIRELPIAGTHRAILHALLDFSLTRRS